MKQLKIYVAGPLTSDDNDELRSNIKNAIEIGEKIMRLGHLPYVPHSHFAGWDLDIHKFYPQFFEHGMSILTSWADSLYFMGPSKGADTEKAMAEKLGLKIFTDISEIQKRS